MATVEKSVLVHFSAQQIFDLVQKVGDYPKFLPWCSAASAEWITENTEKATVEISFKGVKQAFTTINELEEGRAIHMRLSDGPFKRLQGEWRFIELKEDACKVTFSIDYEFSSRVLEQLIGPVFTSITNNLVDSFIKRAEYNAQH